MHHFQHQTFKKFHYFTNELFAFNQMSLVIHPYLQIASHPYEAIHVPDIRLLKLSPLPTLMDDFGPQENRRTLDESSG